MHSMNKRGQVSHTWPLLQLTRAEARPPSFVCSFCPSSLLELESGKEEAQKSSSLNCHLRHILGDIFSDSLNDVLVSSLGVLPGDLL